MYVRKSWIVPSQCSVYAVYELQHVLHHFAVTVCMCELQRARGRVVIASLFDRV